jgi:hypothetical protein
MGAAAAGGHLRHVRMLALHGTCLDADLIPAFQAALAPLEATLEHLELSNGQFLGHACGHRPPTAGDKWMMLRAVAKLRRLHTLRVSAALWERLMSDGADVADPLCKIEGVAVVDADSGAALWRKATACAATQGPASGA